MVFSLMLSYLLIPVLFHLKHLPTVSAKLLLKPRNENSILHIALGCLHPPIHLVNPPFLESLLSRRFQGTRCFVQIKGCNCDGHL